MLTLIQFPWSPFCITIRHILRRHHIPFKPHNIAFHDRAPVITATKGAGYTVPCLIDVKRGICDVTDLGQEVARYVDRRYRLGLFPQRLDGLRLFSRVTSKMSIRFSATTRSLIVTPRIKLNRRIHIPTPFFKPADSQGRSHADK